ncbi:Rieske (2Fe-2S) protein [Streptomyces sp. NPDC046197]|uniref:Rieske (2Fe-2S) protein n=1 Tax=Streptomyces sp. NPDC046197 TaxID=3154337 RepID=UPI0033DBD9F2
MTSESLQPQGTPARRTVVAAMGAAGLAVALTACGSDNKSSSGSSTTQNGSNTGSGGSGGGAAAAGSGGTVLAKTADIPEGGGKVLGGVVVTQPTKGEFKAFSSKCTHQGCPVNEVVNGVIKCPCHHSEFSATDGSVKKGPATQPLAAKSITVSGDEIKMA